MRKLCNDIGKDISALNREHEFKYQFFLFISYYSSNGALLQEGFHEQANEFRNQAKQITSIRSQYLSGGIELGDEDKLTKLSEELEMKLEQVIGSLKDLDNISVNECKKLEMWQTLSEFMKK
ncbi:hypothetical protein [Metallosphaera sp.]|uniref:hypothetical protein n=1 Tax=Metallosphaera sp. TaxID=2020860 RepID=UPI003163B4C5